MQIRLFCNAVNSAMQVSSSKHPIGGEWMPVAKKTEILLKNIFLWLGVDPKSRRRKLKTKHLENPARSWKYRSCALVCCLSHTLDLSRRSCQIPWGHNAEGQRGSSTNIGLFLIQLVPFYINWYRNCILESNQMNIDSCPRSIYLL